MGGSRLASTNLPGSLLAVCRSCHTYIEGNLGESRLKGWSVRQSVAYPAEVEVLRLGTWVFLGDDGTIVEVEA